MKELDHSIACHLWLQHLRLPGFQLAELRLHAGRLAGSLHKALLQVLALSLSSLMQQTHGSGKGNPMCE